MTIKELIVGRPTLDQLDILMRADAVSRGSRRIVAAGYVCVDPFDGAGR